MLNTVASKKTVSGPAVELAWPMAQRRLPTLPLSSVFVTVKFLGTLAFEPYSNAPISTDPTLAYPRWSVAGAPVQVPALIAGLFD